MFLGVPRRLVNSERSINALPEADPDTTLLIADNDDEAEVEAAPARHHARHAARVNGYLFKLATLARRATPAAAARRTAAERAAARVPAPARPGSGGPACPPFFTP